MRPLKPLLIGVAAVGALAVVLVLSGCGGRGAAKKSANQFPWVSPAVVHHPLTSGGQTIAIKAGGARSEHTSPSNLAVEPGVPLTLTFINYTTSLHTFTSPGLGVSALIRAGTKRTPAKTVVTFTPNKFGVFRWYCAFPCGRDMSGRVYAIIE